MVHRIYVEKKPAFRQEAASILEDIRSFLRITSLTGLRLLNCHSGDAVMVGDRMDTDVISGMESGMSTVLVLSGVSTRETLKTYAYRPSIVLDGVGDIAAMARREKA